jgi:hypothetical protein
VPVTTVSLAQKRRPVVRVFRFLSRHVNMPTRRHFRLRFIVGRSHGWYCRQCRRRRRRCCCGHCLLLQEAPCPHVKRCNRCYRLASQEHDHGQRCVHGSSSSAGRCCVIMRLSSALHRVSSELCLCTTVHVVVVVLSYLSVDCLLLIVQVCGSELLLLSWSSERLHCHVVNKVLSDWTPNSRMRTPSNNFRLVTCIHTNRTREWIMRTTTAHTVL